MALNFKKMNITSCSQFHIPKMKAIMEESKAIPMQ